MTVAELKEMIDSNDWDIEYSRFGIRIQEQPFELGAMDPVSYTHLDVYKRQLLVSWLHYILYHYYCE